MIDKEKIDTMSDEELIEEINKREYLENEYTDQLISRYTMFDDELSEKIEDIESYMKCLEIIDEKYKTNFKEIFKNKKDKRPDVYKDPITGTIIKKTRIPD